MVEIRKFEVGRFRCEEEPLAIYHFNHTEIALTHFLEENFETVSNQSP